MPLDRRDVVASLVAKGFEPQAGNRDHDFFFLKVDGLLTPIYTKVSRGRNYRVIGDPLVARMSRQLHLRKDQFQDLVACPLDRDGYEAILRESGKIVS